MNNFKYCCFDHISIGFFLLMTVVRIHNSTCLYLPHSGIITLFLIRSLGSAKGHLGAFRHLRGVNSSPREAVWLSHNPRPPRPQTQHSPNHSDSQMVAIPAASHHAFQLSLRLGKAIAQLSALGDTGGLGVEPGRDGRQRIPASKSWKRNKL